MDRVTKVKKHLKREQWKTLIKECQTSGMTIAAWCKQNDICEVSAKYSCGFSISLVSSIIVGERYLDYFTTITEDRL